MEQWVKNHRVLALLLFAGIPFFTIQIGKFIFDASFHKSVIEAPHLFSQISTIVWIYYGLAAVALILVLYAFIRINRKINDKRAKVSTPTANN